MGAAAAEPPSAMGLVSSVVNDTLEFYRWTWSIRGNAPGRPRPRHRRARRPPPAATDAQRLKMAPSPGRRGERSGPRDGAAAGTRLPCSRLPSSPLQGRSVQCLFICRNPAYRPEVRGASIRGKVSASPGRPRVDVAKSASQGRGSSGSLPPRRALGWSYGSRISEVSGALR